MLVNRTDYAYCLIMLLGGDSCAYCQLMLVVMMVVVVTHHLVLVVPI
jgi:hypothetical protein